MTSQQQPLQNHLIISTIGKYLKFREVKNFRLVCRQWNLSSKPFFQNKSCIIFKSEDGRTRIRKFLKENFQIFVNFKFINIDFRDKYRKIYQFFLEQLGPRVREIALVKCEADYGEVLNGLSNLVVLSIALPPIHNYDDPNNNIEAEGQSRILTNANVKCLEITGRLLDGSVNGFCWNNFIQAFPNLENFGGQCRTSEDLTVLLSILSGQPSPLQKLSDFSCVLTDLHNSHLEMLFSINSKLTNIDLSLAEDVDASLVTALLGNYADILRSIKLFRDSNVPSILFSAVDTNYTFPNLLSLEVPCNMIESLDFLRIAPNLKNLSLVHFGDGDVTFHNTLVRNSSSKLVVKNLESFSYEYFLAPDCLEKVMGIFPNVQRLTMYLTDETIRVVFREGLQLQELVILGTQLSDEGVTGVPLNLLERKYRFMKDYRKLPYIGNLKNLWRFALYPQPQEKITDFSVHYGFMDVENLSCLDIPETAISDEGIETLQGKSNLVTLISPFYTPDGCIYSRPPELQFK